EPQQAVEQVESLDVGELHIAEDDLEERLGGAFERFLAAAAGADVETLLCEIFGEGIANERLVIDNQHTPAGHMSLPHLAAARNMEVLEERAVLRTAAKHASSPSDIVGVS